jgi:ABC-2 type transport system ATP-binding protein
MINIKQENSHLRLYVKDGAKAIAEVLRLLNEQDIDLITITLSTPSLDDVFLQQTGRSLRDLNAKGGDK